MLVKSICRICLSQKNLSNILQLHDNMRICDKIMVVAKVLICPEDSLPKSICSECLTRLDAAYKFKQDCELTDLQLQRDLTQAIALNSKSRKKKTKNNHRSHSHRKIFENCTNQDKNQTTANKCQDNNPVDILKTELDSPNNIADIDDDQLFPESTILSVLSEKETCDNAVETIDGKMLKSQKVQCFTCRKVLSNQETKQTTVNKHFDNNLVDSLKIELDSPNDIAHIDNEQLCPETTIISVISKKDTYHNVLETNDRKILKSRKVQGCNCGKVLSNQEKIQTTANKYLDNNPVYSLKTEFNSSNDITDIDNEQLFPDSTILSVFSEKDTHDNGVEINDEKILKSQKAQCFSCGKFLPNQEKIQTSAKKYLDNNPVDSLKAELDYPNNIPVIDNEHLLPESTFLSELSGKDTYDNVVETIDGKMLKSRKAQCFTCGKVLSSRFRLKTHMRIHTGEKPFKCLHCNKTFSLLQSLKVHMRVHTGEKPLACNTCGKCFAQSAGLAAHIRLHTGATPYHCTLCPKTFRTPGHLQYHIRKHTGEKNFECNICHRAFITRSDLKQHTVTHTGQKLHVCSVCGMRLTRASHLKRHLALHNIDKTFRCKLCNCSYVQKSDLERHEKKHSVEIHAK